MATTKVPLHLRKKRGRPPLHQATIRLKLPQADSVRLAAASEASGLAQAEILRRAITAELDRMYRREMPARTDSP